MRAYSDNFDVFSVIEKKLLFRLLREVQESRTDALPSLLGEVLGLPVKRRKELEKLWK